MSARYAVAIALAACAPRGPADPVAMTLAVCPGSAYPTIQSAIDEAPAGASIDVCAGSFAEHLVVAGGRLTLRGAPGAEVVVDGGQVGVGLSVTGGADVTVEGLTFANGTGAGSGGNVSCVDSTLRIASSRLEGGLADRGGGLGASGCAVTLTDTVIVANTATGDEGGGGLHLDHSDGTVTGVEIGANTAFQGGGAWVSGDGMVFEATAFHDNAAEYGGGVYLDGEAAFTDATFTANTATRDGGGLFALESRSAIDGTAFVDNRSGNDGAGLYLDGGTGDVSGGTFTGNAATGDAGALRIKLAVVTVVGNTFTANTAGQWGGAAKISHLATLVAYNEFIGNSAWKGGAVALDESDSIVLNNRFEGNTAGFGGALLVSGGWDGPIVEDTTFSGNTASRRGGHAYLELLPGIATTFRRVDLLAGAADLGGALYVDGSDVALINTTVRANTAATAGGGVYVAGGHVAIAQALVWDNASAAGSAVLVDADGDVAIVGSVLGRHAGGAAIEVRTGAASWRYSDLYENSTDHAGFDAPIGEGNLAVDPGFASEASLDFALAPGSALIDAGDPSVTDPDLTRADIGRYGGPDALAP